MRNEVALLGFVAAIALTSLFHQLSSSNGWMSGPHSTAKKIEEIQTDFNQQLSKLTELVLSQQKVDRDADENILAGRQALLQKLHDAKTVADPAPKPKKIGEPRHVVFSTGRPQKLERLEQVIAKNARLSMMALPRTFILYIDNDNKAIGKNPYGYPLLKDMFLHAISLVPDADTFTYFNHDLIFNASFVDTMDAIVYAARAGHIKSRFLAVGFRTNVNWRDDMVVGNDPEDMSNWDFSGVFRSGTRFQDDAQDYFTFSRNAWDWNTIPPFVIGRTAYDNWLVNKVVGDPEMTAIDASETNPVIHQTGPAGNYQGHQGTDRANLDYNRILGRGDWGRGQMSQCNHITVWGSDGAVVVKKRH